MFAVRWHTPQRVAIVAGSVPGTLRKAPGMLPQPHLVNEVHKRQQTVPGVQMRRPARHVTPRPQVFSRVTHLPMRHAKKAYAQERVIAV